MAGPTRIGVISDTHGSLDSRVHDIFAGVSSIIHAGDIGRPEILWELQTIAPVTAVLGNTDSAHAIDAEPLATLVVDGCRILAVHDRGDLSPPSIPSDTCVVVCGHTHVPRIEGWHGILCVNPGSASRPRGGSTASVALIEVENGSANARIVTLG